LFKKLGTLYAPEEQEQQQQLLVVLQSPLDVTHRDILVVGTMDPRVSRVLNLRDGDHLKVAYAHDDGGTVVTTASDVLKRCIREQFGGVERPDGSVLITKRIKRSVLQDQVECWQRALANKREPVVIRMEGQEHNEEARPSPAKRKKTRKND
jgi:hypothetical protein